MSKNKLSKGQQRRVQANHQRRLRTDRKPELDDSQLGDAQEGIVISRFGQHADVEATEIAEGDLVVHQEYGIGRYDGLATLHVTGAPHDCLRLLYDGGDKLFLPVENIEMLSRFGSETAGASLDKLGGASWQARKAKLKKRLLDHAATDNIRYTQVIVNHGREAGASLAHPHGQLLGLPFVPGEILDEERAFVRFEGGCILCATVEAELVSSERVLFATDDAVAICPWWSGGPYEILIIPRHHDLHLPDASDEQLAGVGRAIRESLVHLNNLFDDVSFNLVFHTAPHHHNGAFHWHIHLFPKLTTVAGFERGTGVMINIVPPEQAAAELRRVGTNAESR